MKTKSNDPNPPGIIVIIPATADTMKIGNRCVKGILIDRMWQIEKISRNAHIHSMIEIPTKENIILLVKFSEKNDRLKYTMTNMIGK